MYQSSAVQTQHALARSSQRGIDVDIQSLVNIFGEDIPARNGAFIRRIPKASMPEIKEYIGSANFAKVQKKLKAYIVRDNNKVVTVGYQTKRFKA